jgi:hypothetical protein
MIYFLFFIGLLLLLFNFYYFIIFITLIIIIWFTCLKCYHIDGRKKCYPRFKINFFPECVVDKAIYVPPNGGKTTTVKKYPILKDKFIDTDNVIHYSIWGHCSKLRDSGKIVLTNNTSLANRAKKKLFLIPSEKLYSQVIGSGYDDFKIKIDKNTFSPIQEYSTFEELEKILLSIEL